MLHLNFNPLHGMTICLSFRNVISTLMVCSINQIMQKIITAAQIGFKKKKKKEHWHHFSFITVLTKKLVKIVYIVVFHDWTKNRISLWNRKIWQRAFDFKQSYWKRQPPLTLKRNSSPSVALPSYSFMAMESRRKATLLVWWGTRDKETMV